MPAVHVDTYITRQSCGRVVRSLHKHSNTTHVQSERDAFHSR